MFRLAFGQFSSLLEFFRNHKLANIISTLRKVNLFLYMLFRHENTVRRLFLIGSLRYYKRVGHQFQYLANPMSFFSILAMSQ